MAMPVWSDQPFWRTANAESEVAEANHPLLRLFDTVATRDIAPDAPRYDLRYGAEWRPCSPETVRTFSACGYFFGREYQASVGVPVGLIAANWGGTEIAAWVSADKMARAGWKPFRQPEPGSAEYQVHLLGSTFARMKLKGIDGDPHKRWSMWFNSKQREEPYQVLTS